MIKRIIAIRDDQLAEEAERECEEAIAPVILITAVLAIFIWIIGMD